MRTILLALAALLLAAGSGCNDPAVTDVPGITDAELAGLVDPVDGAMAADYRAKDRSLRVFGVQGDPAFATVADTRTWETWNLHEGETLGRGLRAHLAGATLTLENAQGAAVTLTRGAPDAGARTIAHRLDEAAVYQGRARWSVDAASIEEVRLAKGVGAESAQRLDLFPVPAVELVSVDPAGALAHLGLQTGDFLFELNGQPVDWQNLGAIVAAASEPGGTFTLAMYRAGAPGTRTFTVH